MIYAIRKQIHPVICQKPLPPVEFLFLCGGCVVILPDVYQSDVLQGVTIKQPQNLGGESVLCPIVGQKDFEVLDRDQVSVLLHELLDLRTSAKF